MKTKKLCKTISLTLILLLFFTYHITAQVYNTETVPNDNLKNRYDFVSNPNSIISPKAEQELNNIIIQIQDSTSAEVAVVLLKSIGNANIGNFATSLFTKWGIGKSANDNGLLFLLVEDQRQMVFRTGYGLEGVLPDIILSRIIRNDITPYLKQGNYNQAIINGISEIKALLLNPDSVDEIIANERAAQDAQYQGIINFFKTLLIMYLILSVFVTLSFVFRAASKLKMWDKVPDKYNDLANMKSSVILCSVFFPIPMLLFAVYYFYKLNWLRNNPIDCPVCHSKMIKEDDDEVLNLLNNSQLTEESIRSVDYDVWHCNNCKHNEILGFDNPNSSYTECPNCKAKTYNLQRDHIVKNATPLSKGEGEKIYECKNCKFKKAIPYIIPMIIVTSINSGRRSRGGFGGGSIGGGFGGGRTGGGGARGGW
ncbi:uncharacterized protein M2138_001091 [Dysgonomonadaceae bacterium PH5-43]|nr:uncharacterized protein [Dysgonomonadaceae bacterium PH5-43]